MVCESFSFNGTCVYDDQGNLCKHLLYIELAQGHKFSNRTLAPGEKISITTTPNYQMEKPGKYALYFSIYPASIGRQQQDAPDEMIPIGGHENPVISNKISVEVVK